MSNFLCFCDSLCFSVMFYSTLPITHWHSDDIKWKCVEKSKKIICFFFLRISHFHVEMEMTKLKEEKKLKFVFFFKFAYLASKKS